MSINKHVYLGIAGVYSHNSAAALIIDGKIVAAVEEERFIREKNSGKFPYNAVNFCLKQSGLTPRNVDCVAYFMNPKLRYSHATRFNFSTLCARINHIFPRKGLDGVINSLKAAAKVESAIFQGHKLAKQYVQDNFPNARFVEVCHHDAHAASAFLVSPFSTSSVLTVDLVGEWDTTCLYMGKGNQLERLGAIYFPNSLGKLYQMFTKFLGFIPNSDEYKVMGLAAYGTERFIPFFDRLYNLTSKGSFELNKDLLLFCKGIRPEWDEQITSVLGQPRQKEESIDQNHRDIAYALQYSTERILLHLVGSLVKRTGDRRLCMAGGVALNALANQRIRESGLVEHLFIQPASQDAGTAIGAALFRYFLDNPRAERHEMKTCYLGPEYTRKDIENAIQHLSFLRQDGAQTIERVIDHLISGKIVGLFQGRMEFGPRALGNRSILADPRNAKMKDILNSKVKFRESFRPFAPVILEERVRDYFLNGISSPFMTQTFTSTERGKKEIPATIHQDGTARIQTVTCESNPLLYKIIKLFEKRTGVPALMNTSFNVAGEPIVCSPTDAVKTFINSGIDVLIMEDILIAK